MKEKRRLRIASFLRQELAGILTELKDPRIGFTSITRVEATDDLKEAKVFDHTLVIFGSGMSDGSTHSNRNLPVLLAGGALAHQGHVVCPAEAPKRVPLSNLWLSALRWFGTEAERFGRSTGTFSLMEVGAPL